MSSEFPVLVLGGGCFWCTEAVFDRVRGVLDVESGYSNGEPEQPSYEQVCSGDTGHAEVVRLVYDPAQVSVRQLLEIFFGTHDPTTLNRQGNDIGTQYRSAIFYHSPEQRHIAEAVIDSITKQQLYERPIVTEVVPAAPWYEAEAYHQEYFARNPFQGYCQFVVGPKVAKFRKQFSSRLRT